MSKTMTETRPGQVTSQPHMAAISNKAATLEPEIVLNDHYSFQEYINRRSFYLGNQPTYRSTNISVFPIARRNAHEIFSSERESLSVQEIHGREIRFDIKPCLPLPTTANTETIDSFKSYPETEWTPAMSHPWPPQFAQLAPDSGVMFRSSTPSFTTADDREDPPSGSATFDIGRIQPLDIASAVGNPGGVDKLVGSSSSSEQSLTSIFHQESNADRISVHSPTAGLQLARPSIEIVNESLMQTSNTTKASASKLQSWQRASSQTSSSLQPSGPLFSADMSDQPSTQPTSPSAINSSGHATPRVERAPQVATKNHLRTQNLLTTSGTEPTALPSNTFPQSINDAIWTPNPPEYVTVAEGVSSLMSRAMPTTIKTARGKKRARSTTPEATVESIENEVMEDSSEIVAPPKKKLKLNHTKKLEKESSPPVKSNKSTSSKSKTDHIEAIISGTALPQTTAEAELAAKTRYARLVAQRKASTKSRSKLARKAHTDPNLLPEFFSTRNFPEGYEHDQVRCVCGTVHVDYQLFIQCGKCDVWQHNACMGEAVPKNVVNGKYSCHVCDPWAHRKLVAELRQENPLI